MKLVDVNIFLNAVNAASPFHSAIRPWLENALEDDEPHLAALAISHGAELVSCDTDFARFPKLRWRNPLE